MTTCFKLAVRFASIEAGDAGDSPGGEASPGPSEAPTASPSASAALFNAAFTTGSKQKKRKPGSHRIPTPIHPVVVACSTFFSSLAPTLRMRIDMKRVALLRRSPTYSLLRVLSVKGKDVTDSVVTELLQHLPQLRRLELAGSCRCTDALADAIIQHAPMLDSINFSPDVTMRQAFTRFTAAIMTGGGAGVQAALDDEDKGITAALYVKLLKEHPNVELRINTMVWMQSIVSERLPMSDEFAEKCFELGAFEAIVELADRSVSNFVRFATCCETMTALLLRAPEVRDLRTPAAIWVQRPAFLRRLSRYVQHILMPVSDSVDAPHRDVVSLAVTVLASDGRFGAYFFSPPSSSSSSSSSSAAASSSSGFGMTPQQQQQQAPQEAQHVDASDCGRALVQRVLSYIDDVDYGRDAGPRIHGATVHALNLLGFVCERSSLTPTQICTVFDVPAILRRSFEILTSRFKSIVGPMSPHASALAIAPNPDDLTRTVETDLREARCDTLRALGSFMTKTDLDAVNRCRASGMITALLNAVVEENNAIERYRAFEKEQLSSSQQQTQTQTQEQEPQPEEKAAAKANEKDDNNNNDPAAAPSSSSSSNSDDSDDEEDLMSFFGSSLLPKPSNAAYSIPPGTTLKHDFTLLGNLGATLERVLLKVETTPGTFLRPREEAMIELQEELTATNIPGILLDVTFRRVVALMEDFEALQERERREQEEQLKASNNNSKKASKKKKMRLTACPPELIRGSNSEQLAYVFKFLCEYLTSVVAIKNYLKIKNTRGQAALGSRADRGKLRGNVQVPTEDDVNFRREACKALLDSVPYSDVDKAKAALEFLVTHMPQHTKTHLLTFHRVIGWSKDVFGGKGDDDAEDHDSPGAECGFGRNNKSKNNNDDLDDELDREFAESASSGRNKNNNNQKLWSFPTAAAASGAKKPSLHIESPTAGFGATKKTVRERLRVIVPRYDGSNAVNCPFRVQVTSPEVKTAATTGFAPANKTQQLLFAFGLERHLDQLDIPSFAARIAAVEQLRDKVNAMNEDNEAKLGELLRQRSEIEGKLTSALARAEVLRLSGQTNINDNNSSNNSNGSLAAARAKLEFLTRRLNDLTSVDSDSSSSNSDSDRSAALVRSLLAFDAEEQRQNEKHVFTVGEPHLPSRTVVKNAVQSWAPRLAQMACKIEELQEAVREDLYVLQVIEEKRSKK